MAEDPHKCANQCALTGLRPAAPSKHPKLQLATIAVRHITLPKNHSLLTSLSGSLSSSLIPVPQQHDSHANSTQQQRALEGVEVQGVAVEGAAACEGVLVEQRQHRSRCPPAVGCRARRFHRRQRHPQDPLLAHVVHAAASKCIAPGDAPRDKRGLSDGHIRPRQGI